MMIRNADCLVALSDPGDGNRITRLRSLSASSGELWSRLIDDPGYAESDGRVAFDPGGDVIVAYKRSNTSGEELVIHRLSPTTGQDVGGPNVPYTWSAAGLALRDMSVDEAGSIYIGGAVKAKPALIRFHGGGPSTQRYAHDWLVTPFADDGYVAACELSDDGARVYATGVQILTMGRAQPFTIAVQSDSLPIWLDEHFFFPPYVDGWGASVDVRSHPTFGERIYVAYGVRTQSGNEDVITAAYPYIAATDVFSIQSTTRESLPVKAMGGRAVRIEIVRPDDRVDWHLFDVLGRLVARGPLDGRRRVAVYRPHSPGVYFLRAKGRFTTGTARLVVVW